MASRRETRKRKRAAPPSASSQLREKLRETARRKEDPYGVLDVLGTSAGDGSRHTPCCEGDHARRKNCAGNILCVYGLGEGKEGVWAKSPPQLEALGGDPLDGLRIEKPPDGAPLSAAQLSPCRPAGLMNLGATCYVNALLQCLFHNPFFRQAVFSYREGAADAAPPGGSRSRGGGGGRGGGGDGAAATTSEERKVVLALQDLFGDMQGSLAQTCDPSRLAGLLGLNSAVQQDAQEFNTLFLAHIERVLRAGDGAPGAGGAAISSLFEGKQRYVTTCSACGWQSARDVPYHKLEVNIQGRGSVSECVAGYLAPEELSGENRYHCEACAAKVDASRSIELLDLPPVLNLQLLRYIYNRTTLQKQKLKTRVRLELELSLPRADGAAVPYDLVAVLHHRGASAHGGHYVAEVKDWDSDAWWLMDDAKVTRSTGSAPPPPPAGARDVVDLDDPAAPPPAGSESDGDPDFDDAAPPPSRRKARQRGKAARVAKPKAAKAEAGAAAPPSQASRGMCSADAYMLVYRRRGFSAPGAAAAPPPPSVAARVAAGNEALVEARARGAARARARGGCWRGGGTRTRPSSAATRRRRRGGSGTGSTGWRRGG